MIIDDTKRKAIEFSKFAQSDFYESYFKPYLKQLLENEMSLLGITSKSEFESIRRDIHLETTRHLINKIIKKIEQSHEIMDKAIQNEVQVGLKKINN